MFKWPWRRRHLWMWSTANICTNFFINVCLCRHVIASDHRVHSNFSSHRYFLVFVVTDLMQWAHPLWVWLLHRPWRESKNHENFFWSIWWLCTYESFLLYSILCEVWYARVSAYTKRSNYRLLSPVLQVNFLCLWKRQPFCWGVFCKYLP